MENLKRAVEIARLEKGYSKGELVERVEMSSNAYYAALKSKMVTVAAVGKIAAALGMKTSELIRKAEKLSE